MMTIRLSVEFNEDIEALAAQFSAQMTGHDDDILLEIEKVIRRRTDMDVEINRAVLVFDDGQERRL